MSRKPLIQVVAVPPECPHCHCAEGYRVRKTLALPCGVRRYVDCIMCGRRFALMTYCKRDNAYGVESNPGEGLRNT